MAKTKATLKSTATHENGGDVAAPANNVTPITGRAKLRSAPDKGNTADAAGTSVSENEPALIVFGLDESGKAHASSFGAADAELAERAAGLMRYRVLRVTSPDIRAKALELAVGRVFASGRAFTPFCKMAAYAALEAFPQAFQPPPPVETEAAPPTAITGTPLTWDDIGPGSLVLASMGDNTGWFESVVVEARGDDLFTLKWHGWPDDPEFARRRESLALLPPAWEPATDAASPAGSAA